MSCRTTMDIYRAPSGSCSSYTNHLTRPCVVHLLRASMRYASYTDRKKMAAALRPIYTAATEEAAKL
ncbi:transposase, partial [Mycolicibacterium frederiksbergense]|uniref:transposase n=1 Tax=Mycolicibacterium frederiksbergense TaxID=117567 RepID=UPI0039F148E8